MWLLTYDQIPEDEACDSFETIEEVVQFAIDNLNENDGEHGRYSFDLSFAEFNEVLYKNGYFLEWIS